MLEINSTEKTIEACLTHTHTGDQRLMTFNELPSTMQINSVGCWSLGPELITPWNWVAELCVVAERQRRRIIVRHSSDGIEQVVYVREARDQHVSTVETQPLNCIIRPCGGYSIWQPEPDVELLLDSRDRQMGDATCCGLRWFGSHGGSTSMVRRYGSDGTLHPISDAWP
mgnify:CR=1 FL=1